jgi:hypothetical protein
MMNDELPESAGQWAFTQSDTRRLLFPHPSSLIPHPSSIKKSGPAET